MGKKKKEKDIRDYQQEAVDAIFDAFTKGCRAVLFQQPTGTGKTYIFNHIAKLGVANQRKILIVVPKRELVYQTYNDLKEYHDVEAGMILSGEDEDRTKLVQVASISTLDKRDYPSTNLVIIDEAHHATAKTWKKLFSHYPKSTKFLGVTATPCRLNGEGFEGIFDKLIPSRQIRWFQQKGYLAQVKYHYAETPDLKGVKTKGKDGDYLLGALGRVMMQKDLIADVLASYKAHANNKSCICFAVTVEHSKALVKEFKKAKISAAHIDSKTPKKKRDQILKDFKNKKILVLCNVFIISEGFNMPYCDCVLISRPTKSLSLYLQMCGRALRAADNKKYGLILDCAGTWVEHGQCNIDREWSLKGSSIKERQEEITFVGYKEDVLTEFTKEEFDAESSNITLTELSDEIERLLIFESFRVDSAKKKHSILRPYYRFLEYLGREGKTIIEFEYNYVKKRCILLNDQLPADDSRRFKKGFFYFQDQLFKFPEKKPELHIDN